MTSGETAKSAGRVVLLQPDLENLSGFEAALAAGWSPDPRRAGNEAHVHGELQRLRQNRLGFLHDLIPDGRQRAGFGSPPLTTRLFWIWDGEFCGSISLRFQAGTEELPPEVSGHVGYSVVPWKQRNGHATTALSLLMAVASKEGLDRLVVLCNEDNDASRRVIERNGGELFMRGPHPSDRPDQIKLYFWLRPGTAS
ncbi:GNAT family N-acetyltransferase [Rhizobium leguminosarum]|jgi:predicted acetyltransferase|uniref:GNAT family N-acetyltransferase n=1 Tax=Rhizobium TaxID=379 RepID=UPI00038147F6|nr:GNAT family N-acetyltransferase [Rhizobium leguminosarum]MDH6658431.1 putative acetyltransferase [Rhizobium sophorae]MBA8834079.1 putative acetyltransferase [Rhizobium leguminosarum]MBB4520550.1 putative acetyltransferase [Rhizobium leguminosarum]MDH6273898.1 putative acetyltransferase [Rhizobium leguminosarum]MVO93104.1 GNAT family N-acetyltransferase [Rhizobium leguminosarum bv. phaseoli]